MNLETSVLNLIDALVIIGKGKKLHAEGLHSNCSVGRRGRGGAVDEGNISLSPSSNKKQKKATQ